MVILIVILSIIIIWLMWLYQGKVHANNIASLKKDLEEQYSTRIEREKKDYTMRSNSINKGFDYEKLAPYLEGFPYNPRSMIFFGKPIDYVCFEENENGEYNIIFVDIKTGTARLTKEQKMIQEAIKYGRISFHEINIKDGGTIGKNKKTNMPPEVKE